MADGVYQHPPGHLSRWGVVDVGLKCPHSCRHCFYSFLGGEEDQFTGMRHARWHKIENLFALVDSLKEHGFLGFDVTGGEPTAHPKIVEVIKHASEQGLAGRIITLGQFLTRRNLLQRLLDAGITDFRFSLHAVDPAMFHRMTGGDVKVLVEAMDDLQWRGFQYITNTTITEQNYTALPEIARWIAGRPEIYATTWLFFMPYYQWATAHQGEHRVRYSDIAPYLREAVETVEAAGIAATIRYVPQCTIRGMERNHVGIVGVRHDIHEWMNMIDHKADPETVTPDDMRLMGMPWRLNRHDTQYPLKPERQIPGIVASRPGKVFPDKCRGCAGMMVCDGVDLPYVDQFGSDEFVRYREFRGDLLDRARLAYLPGHVIKTAPYADAKSVVRDLLAA